MRNLLLIFVAIASSVLCSCEIDGYGGDILDGAGIPIGDEDTDTDTDTDTEFDVGGVADTDTDADADTDTDTDADADTDSDADADDGFSTDDDTPWDSDDGTPPDCDDGTPWDGDDGMTWDGTEWSAATLAQLRTELTAQIPKEDQATGTTLEAFLASDALDAKFARYVVLLEATPEGLEAFAQQGNRQAFLVAKMLEETDLMKQMLVADGAKAEKQSHGFGPAQYGPAIEIYAAIQQASCRAATGVLQRLALAIGLEHSVPIGQRNPLDRPEAPKTVDPVKLYLHFEKAYLDGELDPAFPSLSTWELRFVVYGDESKETLTWGREMLRNYRPDHIYRTDYSWRYTAIVRSDIIYTGDYDQFDRPELQFYQNILMNGGVCGRRAFFGRFILRAFGIPSVKRPSPGHAALAHWTPTGWVVNLGPGWGSGHTGTLYNKDLDFLATTQARVHKEAYMKVKRAQWAGDVMEEPRIYGEHTGTPDFWYGVSLSTQRAIIEGTNRVDVPTQEENNGDALATPRYDDITYGNDGVISIPATAHSKPSGSTNYVLTIDSFADDQQVVLPGFSPQGQTLLRGGTWKSAPLDCTSGRRLRSAGYGVYEDWGLRVAVTPAGNAVPPHELMLNLGDGVTMKLVYISPGTFVMGGENTVESKWWGVDVPKHQVTITRGFYLGKYEVTQAQYKTIMGGNPSKSTICEDCPVDNVSESNAKQFCTKLVEKTNQEVRLPTEAEWEYASRAGKATKWFFGDDPSQLGEYAWFISNADGKSHPVGQKKPNPWGLYDIYGNVWERISDRYTKDYYANSPEEDPPGWIQPTTSNFEYEITVPQSGRYALTAQVVTNNYDQLLYVSANDAKSEITMEMPFTLGSWQESLPVTINLEGGMNTLRFWRDKPPQRGISVKSFTLKPVP